MNRRTFLGQTATATLAAPSILRSAESPNEKMRVAIMGCNGRGMAHIKNYLQVPNVEIYYVCDVDERAIGKGVKAVEGAQGNAPQGITDIRRALDDQSVDFVSIAAPNHWHAPATILACSAGKHVYVEKPGSHNPWEARFMVEAAKHHKRVVQLGNQRRSWPWVINAIARLREGVIGELRFARTWYNNARGSIGKGRLATVPTWLDYDLWQGPAPERPFKDNLVHYNWHWHWHWGNGELGNNGIHALDVARWGLGVDLPNRVTCNGNRYYYDDDQETPDVYFTTFDYGHVGISWESHSCHPRGYEDVGFGINFSGDEGSLVIAGNQYTIYDDRGDVVESVKGARIDQDHFQNFLNCIRDGSLPNSDIADTQHSSMLCHLGNIAYRTGRTLDIVPESGQIVGFNQDNGLWKRDYRQGWTPTL